MRLYLDESVSVALTPVLRQHGMDCLTAREAGNLGATDEFQLSFAAREHRVLFTHDTRDFLHWLTSGMKPIGLTPAFCWRTKSRCKN